MPGTASAGDLLGVAAIEPDGLLVREDGTYVRALEVGAVNPLVLEPAEGERVSAAFGQVAARLPDRQSLQLYVQGTPLALDELLAEETHHCEQAAGAAEDIGEHERAQAIRRLGIAQEQSIRTHALTVAPLALRYLVVCPWQPASRVLSFGRSSRRALRVKADAHERARRDSLRHCEGVRADLEAMGVPGRLLAGAELLDLLHRRFDPDGGLAGGLPASFMSPQVVAPLVAGESAEAASDRAQRLAEAICTAPVGLCDRSRIALGETLEEVFYVSLAPEQTWLGWLLHMMQAPRPFVLSVHVQATERYRERMAQKRRYKRIHGVNRGVEQRGRPLDPDARVQEEEAAELNDELATSAGAGIYRVSIYCALQEPGPDPDPETLKELCQATGREVTMACDARIQHGLFAQRRLWQSTLPLGRDVAARRRKYVSRNVGDTFPLCGTLVREPAGHPARVRAARAHAGAAGPVRPGAPESPAAHQRHERGGQDDGRDHPAGPCAGAGRERVHHRPRRALRLPVQPDPRRRVAAGRRRARTRSTRGTSRTPRRSARRRSTICSRCTRCCWASITPAATATGSQTSRRTCSGSPSPRCMRAAP